MRNKFAPEEQAAAIEAIQDNETPLARVIDEGLIGEFLAILRNMFGLWLPFPSMKGLIEFSN